MLLMHDNTRLHTISATRQMLQDKVMVLDWPARSPYFSLIEHVCYETSNVDHGVILLI